MKKRNIDLRDEKPLLDIAAYARKGRLPTPAERLQISLTVHGVPEVMVKVSGGTRTLSGVERHMAYIGREGKLGLDLDTVGHIAEKGFERSLVRDWNLDVDAVQNKRVTSATGRKPPKLVHNIIFSMPPGTSPRAVQKAVQKLALDEWALKHRYAMALHTDDDHPHVHVVLKAVSEQGVRLNIRKATLRSWRAQFAANLRELGVDANATERAIRGQTKTRKSDGIYRADQRGQSTHVSRRRREVMRLLSSDEIKGHDARSALESTRRTVSAGWRGLAETLDARGDHKFAEQVRFFDSRMPPVRSEKDWLAEEQPAQGGSRSAVRERPQYIR
jgi:hypothetical protein